MATYVQRASAIINALIDGTATQEQLGRIADAFIQVAPKFYNPANPDNPTPNERARPLVEGLRVMLKHQTRAAMERKKRLENEAAVKAAGDQAAADL